MIASKRERKTQSNHERKPEKEPMSAQYLTEEPDREEEETGREEEQNSDLLVSKLSKELSNCRRRRTTGSRTRPDDGPNGAFKSEADRTIKVRGHETLV